MIKASILIRKLLYIVAATLFCGTQILAQNQPADDSPSTPSTKSKKETYWERIDTHWGGRLKLIGEVSETDDDTIFKPVGTGTFWDGSFNFRLINETFFADWLFTDIAYELLGGGGDTVRKTNELEELFPDLPTSALFFGALLDDDRRLMDLTDEIVDEDSHFLIQRLDRLYLALMPQWGSIKIGRQAITWGNGFIFNPFDLFNPFPPTAIDRDYKVGDDMVNVQFSVPRLGDIQGLYVVRRNPETDDVEFDQASLAGKLHAAAGTTEFEVVAGKHFEDFVIGAGSLGYLGDAAWRVDGTWTFLDDDSTDDYLSLVANMDYSWVWFKKNFYGFVEYYYNGLGEDDYQDALREPAISERLVRGELFALGKHYLNGQIQAELHPLFNVYFTAINNVEDPSGILQPYATWDIGQNLQLTGGVNLPYGEKGSEYGGFKLPGTDVRNRAPDNAYLWFFYYF